MLALFVTDTTTVSAQDPEQKPTPQVPDDGSNSSGYGGSNANPSREALAESGSSGDDPANCLLRAHHVHDSTHFDRPGDDRMSGEVRATCAYRVDEISHYSQLQERTGFFRWTNVGVRDVVAKVRVSTASAHGHDQCRPVPRGIRAKGDGFVIVNGKLYRAYHPVLGGPVTHPCGL